MANDAIDYINRDIVNVKNEIQILNKLVRDGNGQPSLMLQVSTLQGNIGLLEATVREEISQLAGSINSLKREAEEKNKLTFQLKTAIIVALISSATSIFIHFYSKSDVKDNVAQQQIIEKLDTLIKTKK